MTITEEELFLEFSIFSEGQFSEMVVLAIWGEEEEVMSVVGRLTPIA